MYLLLSLTETFQNIRGQVVVLNIIKSAIDDLSQVESLRTPRLRSEKGEPPLGFGRKAGLT